MLFEKDEVVDHSNDHFDGDRPASEGLEEKPCPWCGVSMRKGNFASMGHGLAGFESFSDGQPVLYCSKCSFLEECEDE